MSGEGTSPIIFTCVHSWRASAPVASSPDRTMAQMAIGLELKQKIMENLDEQPPDMPWGLGPLEDVTTSRPQSL